MLGEVMGCPVSTSGAATSCSFAAVAVAAAAAAALLLLLLLLLLVGVLLLVVMPLDQLLSSCLHSACATTSARHQYTIAATGHGHGG